MACRRSCFGRRPCGQAVAGQVIVQQAADFRRGRGDSLSGGQDGGCGLGTGIAARPRLRAGEGVLDPDAVPGADDERHGVSFGFPDAVAAGGGSARRVADRVMQQDVAELMGQRPGCLSAGQTGQDTDAPGGPERGAVTGAAVLPLDREALPAGEPAQAVPQAGWRLPRRRGEGGRERDGLTDGLGQIPDVGDTPGVTPAMVLARLFSAVADWFPPAHAGEDLDALFIAVDLASGCTPRLVSPDQGRVRYPGGDQQDISPGLAVQAGGCPQVPGPVSRGADLPGRLVQTDAQRGDPLLPVLVRARPTCGSWRAVPGHHRPPLARVSGSPSWPASRPLTAASHRSRLFATL